MWPVFVINLLDNTARMENSEAALDAQNVAFERLDAVNGWALSAAEIAAVYDEKKNRRRARHNMVKPEIGCYLSHIAAWKKIADGTDPGGTVLEDDFQVSGDLKKILELLATDAGQDWDIVKLFAFHPDRKVVSRRALAPGIDLVEPYRVPTCLIGYVIKKSTAQRLVQNSVPFFRPVDEDQKFFWESNLRVALVVPPPIQVGDQQTNTGTIGSARRAAKKGARVLHLLRSIRYQAVYQILLFWHRNIGVDR